MALPPVDYSARTPGLPGYATVSPEAVAQSEGAGAGLIGAVADLASTFAKKRLESRAEADVNDALGRATDELEDLRIKLESDPDTAGRHEKFAQKSAEVLDRELGKISYGPARDAFKARVSRVAGAMRTQVKVAAAEEEKQVARFKLDEGNDDLLNKALFAKVPAERQAYLDAVRANIEGAVKAGTISGIMGHTRLKGGLGKFEVALADQLIRQNPGQAMRALQDPEQFKYLDAPARTKLITAAQGRIESQNLQAQAAFAHDFQLYQQARAHGQPVDQSIEADLQKRATALGGVKLQHFNTTKRFYDRVDTYAGMSLPELRQASVELGQGSLEDKQVARAVDKIITADTREKTKLLNEALATFKQLREAGEQVPNLPDIRRLAEEVGGPTMVESVDALDAYYSRVNFARERLSAENVRKAIDAINTDRREARGGSLTLEDVHELGALHKALELKTKEAKEDGAAYIMKYYPTVAEAFVTAQQSGSAEDFSRASDAMIAAQQREGIAPQLLAKPAAERLEAQLNSENVGERLAAVDMAKTVFTPRHWPRIKAQLNKGKDLPADVEVLAALPPGAVLDRVRLAEAFKLKETEWQKQLGPDKNVLDDATRSVGATVLRSFMVTPGGAPHADAFLMAARRLSYLNRAQGQTPQQAAANAWDEVFNRHWDLVDGVRVPKVQGVPVIEPARLKTAQDVVLRQLDKLDLLDPVSPELANLTPGQRKAQLVRAVRSYGYWVTDAEERGAFLFAGPNQPVRWADGNPVHLTFDAAATGMFDDVARSIRQEELKARAPSHSSYWERVGRFGLGGGR